MEKNKGLKHINININMNIIVSGASQNHFKSLCQFLLTVSVHNQHHNIKVIIYDLGLNETSCTELLNRFKFITLKKFNYEKYPPYFNININAGQYAWKPCLINEVVEDLIKDDISAMPPMEALTLQGTSGRVVLIWCDAGDKIHEPLDRLINIIKDQGIYSPGTEGDIKRWTHPGVIKYFSIENDTKLLSKINRNGAIIGYDISREDIRQFIKNLANYAQIKDCIAPDGSNRLNHRQDQALFSILYHQFMGEKVGVDVNISITTHNDID